MSDVASDSEIFGARAARRLNGWMVLLYLIGFFAVIFAVNGVMIYEALSTLGGLDTDSAYQAGRMFEHEVTMAKAQEARHWHVDASVKPQGGSARLDIVARDSSGAPIGNLDASAVLERPTDRRLDRTVAVAEEEPGHFHGSVDVISGQWDLVIALSRQGEQLFRSKNRIVLK